MRVAGSETLAIGASPAVCRATLLDLASYPQWYPGVRAAEVLEAGPDSATARLVFGTGLAILAEIECVLRLEAHGSDRVQPSAAGGALTIHGHGWTLAPESGGGTRATYDIGVEMSVPGGFLTEKIIKSRARFFLIEEPLAALKRRVEPRQAGAG